MNTNELAAIFKALSDPNRLAILQQLGDMLLEVADISQLQS